MITVQGKLEKTLVDHGLWPNEATAVMDKAKANLPEMEGRWNESCDNYPPQLFGVLWISIKSVAIEHLKATKPMHFALALLQS